VRFPRSSRAAKGDKKLLSLRVKREEATRRDQAASNGFEMKTRYCCARVVVKKTIVCCEAEGGERGKTCRKAACEGHSTKAIKCDDARFATVVGPGTEI